MTTFITDDEIDFTTYMEATDHDHRVVSVEAYADEVHAYFHNQDAPRGAFSPWQKLADLLRFRPGEVTLWTGINGHGKSLALGQSAVSIAAQGYKVCIASLEMRPVITLARMCRQASRQAVPSPEFIRHFHKATADGLFLYDQLGMVQESKMLAVIRYCAEKRGIQHFVLDSLMKCGLGEDDYSGQKHFVDGLCTAARDYGIHIHLVAHSRKGRDESEPPGKMDVRGAAAITDQVDNVLSVWRNKPKERAQQEGDHSHRDKPDALLTCDKQRNGEWEGRCALFFDRASQQFVERDGQPPMHLLGPPGASPDHGF